MPIYLLSPSTILVVEVIIKLNNMIDKKIEEAKDCLQGWLELNCGQEADLCGYPDWKSAEVE